MSSFSIQHTQTLNSPAYNILIICVDMRIMRPIVVYQRTTHTHTQCSAKVKRTTESATDSDSDKAAVLITGDSKGVITVYEACLVHTRTPLAHIGFTMQQRFYAHSNDRPIYDLHFHRSKPLFVSAAWDKKVFMGIW